MIVEAEEQESDLSALNNGGRVWFEKNKEVRVTELNGSVSKTIYVIAEEEETANPMIRSDRRGLVTVRCPNGELLKVHHKRIIVDESTITAKVFEIEGQLRISCPECLHIELVDSSADQFTCPKCSKDFNTHWIGNTKTMNTEAADTVVAEEATKPIKAAKPPKEKAEKPPKAEKVPRVPKPKPVATILDLNALAATANCEVWTKGQIKFDHATTDVKAHVLVFTGENPRKFSFNTYNGSLGQKADALPVDEFVANKSSKDKAPWFPVDDLEKLRASLTKKGYAKHGA